MRKPKQILGIFWAVLLFFPMYVASQQPFGIERWWEDSEMVQKLQLSDMQLRKFKTIYEEYLNKLIDLNAIFNRDREKLIAMKEAGSADEDEFLAQVNRVDEASKEIEMTQAVMRRSVQEQMTEEQRKRLEENQKFRNHLGMRNNEFATKFLIFPKPVCNSSKIMAGN